MMVLPGDAAAVGFPIALLKLQSVAVVDIPPTPHPTPLFPSHTPVTAGNGRGPATDNIVHSPLNSIAHNSTHQ
jgi:hypothetical protein